MENVSGEHPSVREMLRAWLDSADGDAAASRGFQAWFFCDNRDDAGALADLVVRGEKRATASAFEVYEAEGSRVPEPGDLSIVTDFDGVARCIIRTTRVDVVPFGEVTGEFAATEGEGDCSLAFWRRVHEEFFTRELAEIGRSFSERTPVVCERFEVVFRPRQP